MLHFFLQKHHTKLGVVSLLAGLCLMGVVLMGNNPLFAQRIPTEPTGIQWRVVPGSCTDCEYDPGNICDTTGTRTCQYECVDCGDGNQVICEPMSPRDCDNAGLDRPTPTTQCATRTTDGWDCDDGNACTLTDSCSGGTCRGTGSPCAGDTPYCMGGSCMECLVSGEGCDLDTERCWDGECVPLAGYFWEESCSACSFDGPCDIYSEQTCSYTCMAFDGQGKIPLPQNDSVCENNGVEKPSARQICNPSAPRDVQGSSCDDGNGCTENETCSQDGVCGGGTNACVGDTPYCVSGSCQECNELGEGCSGDETCYNGSCVPPEGYVRDPTSCTGCRYEGTCDDTMENECQYRCIYYDGTSDNFEPFMPQDCIDNIGPQPAPEVCDTRPIVGLGCDDGNACTVNETCNASGVCGGGESPCSGDTPYCMGGECMECLFPSGEGCDLDTERCWDGECVPLEGYFREESCSECSFDGPCDIYSEKTCTYTCAYFDGTGKIPLPLPDKDCEDNGVDKPSARQICNPSDPEIVLGRECDDENGCTVNETCSEDGICGGGENACVGDTPHCDEQNNTCVGCIWDEDCNDADGTTIDICYDNECVFVPEIRCNECQGQSMGSCSNSMVCEWDDAAGCQKGPRCDDVEQVIGRCTQEFVTGNGDYNFNNNGGAFSTADLQNDGIWCESGELNGSVSYRDHRRTWACTGPDGSDSGCMMDERYCGDGELESGAEGCDESPEGTDGYSDPTDGCIESYVDESGETVRYCQVSSCGDGIVVLAGADGTVGNSDDEECDPGGDKNTWTLCTSECKFRARCGVMSSQTHYTSQRDDQFLNDTTPDLCNARAVQGLSRPSIIVPGSVQLSPSGDGWNWTWECQVDGGVDVTSCGADYYFCGDETRHDNSESEFFLDVSSVSDEPAEECDGEENCSDSCTILEPVNGECRDKDITVYNISYSEVELNNSALWCSAGKLDGRVTEQGNEWIWTCLGDDGGTSEGPCRRSNAYCGDTVVQNATTTPNMLGNPDEACDDGNDGLSDRCDTEGTNPLGNGKCSKTFCGDGVLQSQNGEEDGINNGQEQCDPNVPVAERNWSDSQKCTDQCEIVNLIDAECIDDGGEVYYFSNNGGAYDDAELRDDSLWCKDGSRLDGPVEYYNWYRTWSCISESGGAADTNCIRNEQFCGDGDPTGYGPDNIDGTDDDEQCDDGQGNGTDGSDCGTDCRYVSICQDVFVTVSGKTTQCLEMGYDYTFMVENNQGEKYLDYTLGVEGSNGGYEQYTPATDGDVTINNFGANGEEFIGSDSLEFIVFINGEECQGYAFCADIPNKGECGEKSRIAPYYEQVEDPNYINTSTPGLCAPGSVLEGVISSSYNELFGEYQYTRKCIPEGGGEASRTCGASHTFCGNDQIDNDQGSTEQCDGTATGSCEAYQTCRSCACDGQPEPGECGESLNGLTVYSKDGKGTYLEQNDPRLCDTGEVIDFTEHADGWSWKCLNDGLPSKNCSVLEKWCGDDTLTRPSDIDVNPDDVTEQCDGSGDECLEGQSCSNSCSCDGSPQGGECSNVYNGKIIYSQDGRWSGLSETDTVCEWGTPVIFNETDSGWEWRCEYQGQLSDWCQASDRWCGDNTAQKPDDVDIGNPSERCDGDDMMMCDPAYQTCKNCDCFGEPPKDPGVCKEPPHLETRYSGLDRWSALDASDDLCEVGTLLVGSFEQVESGRRWICSNDGLPSGQCEAYDTYCGDGTRDVDMNEQCDWADSVNKDGWGDGGCSKQCEPITLGDVLCGSKDGDILYWTSEYPDLITEDDTELCQSGDRLVVDSLGYVYNEVTQQYEWTWYCERLGGSSSKQSEQCLAIHRFCGDDAISNGETCEGDGQAQCNDGERCWMCACEPVPEPPRCNPDFHEALFYSDVKDTNALKDHPILCLNDSTPFNFRYDEEIEGRRRSCTKDNMDPAYCEAYHTWCGDDIVQEDNNEQCDGTGEPLPPEGYVCESCKLTYMPECGNEVVDGDEDCDDGKNGNNLDECTDECTNTFCGDGDMQKPNGYGQMERCDDANDDPTDGCNACELTYCGDGIPQAPNGYDEVEACDDGNDIAGDGCENDCSISPACGDGTEDDGEECDDGNRENGDGCSSSCKDEFCGDGYRDVNGPDNIAGNGDDEACETDGDCEGSGATCTPSCSCEIPDPVCGNEVIEEGEECDDGKNGNDEDRCTDDCTRTFCGDEIVQAPNGFGEFEECDDNNDDETDGCHECKQTEIIGECSGLAVSDTLITIPNTIDYVCQGDGTQYNVKLFKDGEVVDEKDTASGSFMIDQIGVYAIQCFINNVSSDLCLQEVTGSGYCEQLTVDGNEGYAPYDATFTCDGVGSFYEIVIFNESDELLDRVTGTETISHTMTFEQPGTYRAVCFVDGVSNLVCEDDIDTGTSGTHAKGLDTVQVMANEQINQVVETYVDEIDWSQVERVDDGSALQPTTTPLNNEVKATQQRVISACSNPCEQVIQVSDLCGNGIVDAGEACDDGDQNGTEDSRCTRYCSKKSGGRKSSITCSNGTIDDGEECDDGNVYNGDGCDQFCRIEGGSGPSPKQVCGNGIIELGETCDEGLRNGRDDSLCTKACTLRIFPKPTSDWPVVETPLGDVPKCSYVDPPAVQVGQIDSEILPFWWALEDDGSVIDGALKCDAPGDVGNIPKNTMECTFVLQLSDGTEHEIVKNCFENDLMSVSRWSDLSKHYGPIENGRGKSYIDLSDATFRPIRSYGEFALRLEKISYDVCTSQKITEVNDEGELVDTITYTKKTDQVYDQRVCQYNFPVTTPYFIQKGTALSSRPDDAEKLGNFKKLDGRDILEVSGIETLTDISVSKVFSQFTEKGYDVFNLSQEFVSQGVFAGLGVGVNKVANEEIYTSDPLGTSITLKTGPGDVFNEGKPTTFVVKGNAKVIIEGSFDSNLFLVVPEGTVEFRNIDCDVNDRVRAFVIAKNIDTSTIVRRALPNYEISGTTEWCIGGGLIIDGVLMGGTSTNFDILKNKRRSTLSRWFDTGAGELSTKIFEGAALRINVDASQWLDLPPLADGLMESLRVQR